MLDLMFFLEMVFPEDFKFSTKGKFCNSLKCRNKGKKVSETFCGKCGEKPSFLEISINDFEDVKKGFSNMDKRIRFPKPSDFGESRPKEEPVFTSASPFNQNALLFRYNTSGFVDVLEKDFYLLVPEKTYEEEIKKSKLDLSELIKTLKSQGIKINWYYLPYVETSY
jgi:hypothetical protein